MTNENTEKFELLMRLKKVQDDVLNMSTLKEELQKAEPMSERAEDLKRRIDKAEKFLEKVSQFAPKET